MKTWQIIAIAIGAVGALMLLSRRAMASEKNRKEGRGTPLPPLPVLGDVKSYETKIARVRATIWTVWQTKPRGDDFGKYWWPAQSAIDAAYKKASDDNTVDMATVLKGASAGGAAGTVIPGVGNAIGAVGGAIGGFFKGLYDEHERELALKDQHLNAYIAAYHGISDLMVQAGI